MITKVAVAERPSVKVEHALARRDTACSPMMEMDPPFQPSPNESIQLSVWLLCERQTSSV